MSRSISAPVQPLMNNAGFTLLEIIAVLVIMGILAVVAVPKYFDLQSQARQKAMETAMAEAIGRVNSYFAEQVLNGAVPSEIDYDSPSDDPPLGTDLGDFTLATIDGGNYTGDGTPDCSTITSVAAGSASGCIQLTITPKPTSTALAGTDPIQRIIPRPGV